MHPRDVPEHSIRPTIGELVGTLRQALDAAELEARKHLCIHCGRGTIPLCSPLGVTGWTHDPARGKWEGIRCEGSLTGAEPVQRPLWVIRDVTMKRRLVEELICEDHRLDCCTNLLVQPCHCDCGLRLRQHNALELLAAIYQQDA